jgi:predicted nucleic acid-binding protein
MRKNRVILDTNIFIRGWFFSEKYITCGRIVDMIENRDFYLLFAQDTIGELMYVTKNFARHNLDDINDRLAMLKSIVNYFIIHNQ